MWQLFINLTAGHFDTAHFSDHVLIFIEWKFFILLSLPMGTSSLPCKAMAHTQQVLL